MVRDSDYSMFLQPLNCDQLNKSIRFVTHYTDLYKECGKMLEKQMLITTSKSNVQFGKYMSSVRNSMESSYTPIYLYHVPTVASVPRSLPDFIAPQLRDEIWEWSKI